ncbi:MAG TPA: prepilin-type N-terminal cleavage/methylation domain-containing protein [Methylibium sp.]|nr:prepilin-type N-terminal cleavage/methylation domain-containing protein [Methylibium sp.]
MQTQRRRPAQRGFTILEALIALLVMAFGVLALAGMQVMLSRNGDLAKQRSEATRLAQERMERMRAYDGIGGAGTNDWNNLPGAAETVTTNAVYTVTPAMGGTTGDAMRPTTVTVAWTDRANAAQSVVLSSVISKIEPEDIGFVTNPLPLNQPLRRVKDRNINIPIPAIDLGGGQSATQFDANYVIIYSNTTGGVVQICNPNQANANATQINDAITAGNCISTVGYIVAGYIGRSASGGTAVSDAVFNALGMNLAGVTRTNPDATYGIRCLFSNAIDQNSGATIANFKYYLCIIPLTDPGTPAGPTWSGTIYVGNLNTASNYVVCRYQYTQTAIDVNERNVQPYSGVNKSIDEQNYYITNNSNANACDGLTVSGVSLGVLHQNCRSSNSANHATVCPGISP